MQISTIQKNLLKYLQLLLVIVIAIAGSWVIKDLRSESIDTPQGMNIQLQMEAENKCLSPLIYTSLPPKCRTADGSFIQINEFSSNIILIPESKK